MVEKSHKFIWALFFFLSLSGYGHSQEPSRLGINVGVATWLNNADVPSTGQDTAIQPSFGLFFSIISGKFRFSGTFFYGNYNVKPRLDLTIDASGAVAFANDEARRRGLTSRGEIKKIDLEVSLNYALNRYIQPALGLFIHHSRADLETTMPLMALGNEIVLLPEETFAPLEYSFVQYWIKMGINGSVSIFPEISLFYNPSLLLLSYETGNGTASTPDGTTIFGPRPSFTLEDGAVAFPPRSLGSRTFGSSLGFAFNAGLGLLIIEQPSTLLFVGYNFKYLTEEDPNLIDNSIYKGLYLGISMNVY